MNKRSTQILSFKSEDLAKTRRKEKWGERPREKERKEKQTNKQTIDWLVGWLIRRFSMTDPKEEKE